MATSASDSALGLIRSPRPSLYRIHTRKVSIASADISHIADQNAELLDRLRKLEAEATSADTSMGSPRAKRSLPSHCSQQRPRLFLSAIPQRHLQGLVTRRLLRHLETRRTKTRSPFSTTSATPSPFGTSMTPTAFANNTTPSPFGINVHTQSAFSNNTSSGPSPFGATTQSVFGGGSNNATASKHTEALKTPFGFTGFNTAPSAAPASSSTTTAPAPSFSFGNKNPQTLLLPPQSPARRRLYRNSPSILHNNLEVQRLPRRCLASRNFFPDAKGLKIFHESSLEVVTHFILLLFVFFFHILFICLTALLLAVIIIIHARPLSLTSCCCALPSFHLRFPCNLLQFCIGILSYLPNYYITILCNKQCEICK